MDIVAISCYVSTVLTSILHKPMPTAVRIRPVKRFAGRILSAAICLLALTFAAGGADLPRFKTWNTENGLPQNSIQAITQTPDGYLWIATRDGLARFDGIRFKIFQKSNTPELPTNRLWDLFADDYGRCGSFRRRVRNWSFTKMVRLER